VADKNKLFPPFTTEAEEQMFSLVSKPTHAADDNLCRLAFMSLHNKLPEIDAKLENHGPTTSAVQVDINIDGGTDFDKRSFRLDEVSRVSLFEIFHLSIGNEADGIIQVQAQVLRKLLATETFNSFFS
jgi:hypothetical protein